MFFLFAIKSFLEILFQVLCTYKNNIFAKSNANLNKSPRPSMHCTHADNGVELTLRTVLFAIFVKYLFRKFHLFI